MNYRKITELMNRYKRKKPVTVTIKIKSLEILIPYLKEKDIPFSNFVDFLIDNFLKENKLLEKKQ